MRYIAEITYVKIYDDCEDIEDCQRQVEREHPFLRDMNIVGEIATPESRQGPMRDQ